MSGANAAAAAVGDELLTPSKLANSSILRGNSGSVTTQLNMNQF